MMHGFGPTAVWQWYKQISALQPFFDVYVPDLLFFGQSFTPKKERSEIFQVSEEVLALKTNFINLFVIFKLQH